MSWIKDVTHEIKNLDVSEKSLRKFGLTIGAILLVLSLFLIWKSVWPNARALLIAIGVALFLGGLLNPNRLNMAYKVWMGFAFALGWIVSRFILIILFIFVLTPLGLIAKIFRKEFLDLKFNDKKKSYWITKEKKIIDYEKMY